MKTNVTILNIGDVHLSDHPPSIRTDDYTDDIFAKLEFAVDRAKALKVDALVQAGDMFHIKSPSKTSHALVQRTADLLNGPDVPPVIIVPGNHDLQHDRLESLPKQPLGTLAKTPNVTLLMGPHPELPLFGIPYLHDWPALLSQWMAKYRKWADTNKAEDFDFLPLLITHAPIFPDGEEPPYDFISASDWAELMQNGSCYYGHIHDPHGAYAPQDSNVVLCNNGALSRGSLHEKTLARKPAITLWSSDPAVERFTRIEVPHRPVDQVFKMATKKALDSRSEQVSTFLEGVEKTVVDGLSVEEVIAHAESMNLSKIVLEEIRSCIEEVSTR